MLIFCWIAYSKHQHQNGSSIQIFTSPDFLLKQSTVHWSITVVIINGLAQQSLKILLAYHLLWFCCRVSTADYSI